MKKRNQAVQEGGLNESLVNDQNKKDERKLINLRRRQEGVKPTGQNIISTKGSRANLTQKKKRFIKQKTLTVSLE